jgi:hypothetical protein
MELEGMMKAVKYGVKSIGPDGDGNIGVNAERCGFIEFGKTRERDARALKAGDKMLVNVIHTARILGAVEVCGKRPYSKAGWGAYPHHVRCRWLISVPKSEGIRPRDLLGSKLNPTFRPYQKITAAQFERGRAALLKRSKAA